jgi:hypothetical protein
MVVRERWLPELDPGIGLYVDALHGADVEMFESREGGGPRDDPLRWRAE